MTVSALLAMTLFLKPKMHRDDAKDGKIFSGALFFAVTTATFSGMPEMAIIIQKLPVFFKQRNLLFFPAWAYVLPLWVLSIPVCVAEIAVFTVLTYYEIGFDPNFGR